MNASLFPDLIVNDERVPHAVVAAETQNQSAPSGKPGIAWRKAAKAIAIRTLLLQEARACDVPAEPHEVAPGRFETEEKALIRGLLDQSIEIVQSSASEVKTQWEKDPARFRTPPPLGRCPISYVPVIHATRPQSKRHWCVPKRSWLWP